MRACTVAGFGLLGAWALGPELTLSAGRGDWATVSEGLRPTLDGRALGSNSRAMVHVHDLGPDPAQLVLIVSGRARRPPSVLRIERDGQSFLELPLAPEPRAITVPALAQRDGVDVVLSLESHSGAQPAVFDIHALRLERRRAAAADAAAIAVPRLSRGPSRERR